MNKTIYSAILAGSILSGCVSTKYVYENRTVPGIIFGKVETLNYNLDSLSNNYSIFMMCDVNGDLEGASYADRGIHKIAIEGDSIKAEYTDKYLLKQRGRKTLDKIFIETNGPNKIKLQSKNHNNGGNTNE